MIASLEREGSERREPTAIGLVKFVKTYYFIACCKLLSKVLPLINRLSLLFQHRDVDLSVIQPSLNATILAIEQYREADVGAKELIGEGLSKFMIAIILQAKKDEFKDRVQKKYEESVINQLKECFPYVEQIA